MRRSHALSYMYYFCTYFDHHFLPKGLALYRSLKLHCPAFRLWVLCMDDSCYEALSRLDLPDMQLIALEDFERGDEELLRAKQNRTRIEYYFTCTPSLPLFVLNNEPQVDLITYLDADLFFYADPAPLFAELGEDSIAIIEHRLSPGQQEWFKYGIYNVGWLSFRRDEHALACLNRWREQCIDWCYDRVENGRFADQGYLDEWPMRFGHVKVLQHKGANLAPWNLTNYELIASTNTIWVGDQPLIFYHFHGTKKISSWLYDPGFAVYRVKLSEIILHGIYAEYLRVLFEIDHEGFNILPKGQLSESIRYPATKHHQYKQIVKNLRVILKGIIGKEYIFVLNGNVVR